MYIGRFAPTPSGPLHFGSIIAALGSFLDARKNSGQWLVRIDDLDTPRVQPGASDSILKTLEILGLHWDRAIIYQSDRRDAYQAGLDLLQSNQLIYPCICTRKMVQGKPYPGTCRKLKNIPNQRYALRLIVNANLTGLKDKVQGELTRNLMHNPGDFIVRRSDSIFAYHLAAVIDDNWQAITDVVRGADLIDSTICQIYLQSQLGFTSPAYCHLPVAININGRKISKTNHAQDVLHNSSPTETLLKALIFLGHEPDPGLSKVSVEEIIQWSIANWQIGKVPKSKEIVIDIN